jgi:hypothetical protein
MKKKADEYFEDAVAQCGTTPVPCVAIYDK